MEALEPRTVEAVLDRLGFSVPVEPDRAGLDALYLAWCRTVPFDNLVKRIDLVDRTTPFRNDRPKAFFDLWLTHRAGGTCWPSSRALGALLHTVGFDVRLGSAAMGDEFTGPLHSHGTVLTRLDGELLWVDSSMLTDEPVPLVAGVATGLDHPLRPVRVEPVDDLWRVHWTSGALPREMGCLLLDPDVDGTHYSARYEWSRENSPFNTGLFATRNRADGVSASAWGAASCWTATGRAPATRSRPRSAGWSWSTSSATPRRSSTPYPPTTRSLPPDQSRGSISSVQNSKKPSWSGPICCTYTSS